MTVDTPYTWPLPDVEDSSEPDMLAPLWIALSDELKMVAAEAKVEMEIVDMTGCLDAQR